MLSEEDFEDAYTHKFEELILGRGLKVQYARDRAVTDIGVMWRRPGSAELTGVRVWFQLKGRHSETVSAKDANSKGYVPVVVDVGHLRFWYAAPEATYLVVYVEALDRFLARDVRDIVDERWGPGILAPGNLADQGMVTIHVPLSAVFDEPAVDRVSRAHRSMRIDGPTFQGRPLGHRFDPLRSELNELESEAYDKLVVGLLDAFLFRDVTELDAARFITNVGDDANKVRLLVGTLWTTYEYIFSGSVEQGFGPRVEPRSEGQTFRAFGKTAVIIHSKVADSIDVEAGAQDFVAELAQQGCENFLVFANCEDFAHNLLFPWRRGIFSKFKCMPQGLSSLAYNVLTTTLVYLENAENLSWKTLPYNLGAEAVEVAEQFNRLAGPLVDFE